MARDLGVALGGGNDRKEALAKELNLYSHYLFTGESLLSLENLYIAFLGAFLPQIDLIPNKQSTDTVTDFRVIKDTMSQNHLTSVTIYTSDYHVQRCKMIAGLILYPYFNYSFVPVPSSSALRKARFWLEKITMIKDYIWIKTGKE